MTRYLYSMEEFATAIGKPDASETELLALWLSGEGFKMAAERAELLKRGSEE